MSQFQIMYMIYNRGIAIGYTGIGYIGHRVKGIGTYTHICTYI